MTDSVKYVFDFAEGSMGMKELLGGKGANLCEMTRLGLPVPPGFIITTDACRFYLDHGQPPPELDGQVAEHLERLQQRMGKRLGGPEDPLLLSVRSGGKFSMPGMMETILNVGLNDENLAALAAHGGERFALDAYRRLIVMFAGTVHGVPHEAFESPADDATASDLRALTDKHKRVFAERVGHDFPQDPAEQLRLATRSVFESWNSPRARIYRHQEHIPDHLGTAVNVMAMVFGNMGADSGTGVAFTRDPATGARGVYGDYLPNAQGEDVVAGIRNALPLQRLAELDPVNFTELMSYMDVLEQHYRDLCDIEFTIEHGKLWMLQTRVGKRTAAAAFTIAAQLVDEEVISLDEALLRVNGTQLSRLMFPAFEQGLLGIPLAVGVGASPGAAVGRVAFDSETAARLTGGTILVRRETNPDDLPGILAAHGVLTARGGKTSHAAVVARGLGKTCVCGVEQIEIDLDARLMTVGGQVVREGDLISIDGTTGAVYLGEMPVQASPLVRYFEGELSEQDDPLVEAVARLLRHADHRRTLGVRANADTPEDAARARRFGAAGIGLCRTEHMFLGERRVLIERLIVADTAQERLAALDDLMPMQREDFRQILTAMDGQRVVIRLLDPPLHEFLPSLEELEVKVALGEATEHERELLVAARRLHEQNPMLGLRGVRLGLLIPELYEMQVRAVEQATRQCRAAGGHPRPEIMVPLVGTVTELAEVRHQIQAVGLPVGTMIEVPRAALTAGKIATQADFFSFGTNDLTQMTWGFSRDDVEGAFFSRYLELGIFSVSPFETIDVEGVGRLIELAVAKARAVKPTLSIGVCGEHGGDPQSVRFFAEAGLDYVSCSPFRVPVARLEAGRAAIESEQNL